MLGQYDQQARVLDYGRLRERCHAGSRWHLEIGVQSDMGNLPWIILAFGAFLGGTIIIFGPRKADRRPVAYGSTDGILKIDNILKEDWSRTGNIDFHAASTDDKSSCQPLRLWVEEKRITESAVGQNVVELRWRLATIEEGRELIVCWNNAKPTSPYDVLRGWQIHDERKSSIAMGQVD
jgi:hypothetical protein